MGWRTQAARAHGLACRRCSDGRCPTCRRTLLVVHHGSPFFHNDWWLCMPEPLSPNSGLGMNVTVLPAAKRFA